jgi:hypothetical protein
MARFDTSTRQIGSPVFTLMAWNEPSVPPTMSAAV